MRKSIIYCILLIAALLIPKEPVELGKLKPVEALGIRMEDDIIVIETDTEDAGRGQTVEKAVQNLKDTTSGVIFLDTADYLLVGEGTEVLIPELAGYLKDKVRICGIEENIKPVDAVEYLRIHKPNTLLKQWEQGTQLEKLHEEGGRLIMK